MLLPVLHRLLRRGAVSTVLAFGLALMHGGIGQAISCGGAAKTTMQMTPTSASSIAPAMSMIEQPAAHVVHHQPSDQTPYAAHALQMCLSTPVQITGLALGGAATIQSDIPGCDRFAAVQRLPITAATSREPPAHLIRCPFCANRP